LSYHVACASSDFGVGFRKVVLSGGEVVYKCVKCLSVFCSLYDVGLHVAICGKKREKHGFKYGYVDWCKKPDKGRVLVRNTVDNILLCCGCPYFRLIGVKHLAVVMGSGSYGV